MVLNFAAFYRHPVMEAANERAASSSVHAKLFMVPHTFCCFTAPRPVVEHTQLRVVRALRETTLPADALALNQSLAMPVALLGER